MRESVWNGFPKVDSLNLHRVVGESLWPVVSNGYKAEEVPRILKAQANKTIRSFGLETGEGFD